MTTLSKKVEANFLTENKVITTRMLMISSLDSPPVLVEVAKQASFGGRKMSNEGNRNGKSREATKRSNRLVYQEDVGRNCSIVSVGR